MISRVALILLDVCIFIKNAILNDYLFATYESMYTIIVMKAFRMAMDLLM